jgi:hypothetical protein
MPGSEAGQIASAALPGSPEDPMPSARRPDQRIWMKPWALPQGRAPAFFVSLVLLESFGVPAYLNEALLAASISTMLDGSIPRCAGLAATGGRRAGSPGQR